VYNSLAESQLALSGRFSRRDVGCRQRSLALGTRLSRHDVGVRSPRVSGLGMRVKVKFQKPEGASCEDANASEDALKCGHGGGTRRVERVREAAAVSWNSLCKGAFSHTAA
jgi:hypothetical protein